MNVIKLIKKKKVPEILVSQLDNPKHIRGLREELGGSPNTIDSAVQLLEELELVKAEKTKDFPFKKVPRLTEKGRKIATFLKSSGEIGKMRRLFFSIALVIRHPQIFIFSTVSFRIF